MHTLYVIDSLGQGGAERSLVEMLPGLGAGGVRATVVTLDHREPGYDDEVRDAGGDVVRLRPEGPLRQVAELRRVIRSRRPDIVHTTLFRSDVAGRLAAYRTGAVVVTSLVNTSYEPERLADPNVRRHRLELARLLDGWTARHLTDHFHAVSTPVRDAAVRRLGIAPERVTVVERGRDPDRLGEPGLERRLAVRASLGLSADAPVVITVGRQEYQKGQLTLVDAFDIVAASHPDATLLLVGRPGNASRELGEHRARATAHDRIRALGPRDDVGDLLAAADVFVCASRYEGFAGAVVEAMALGVPVVGTDIPGVRAVARDGVNALLVSPDEPERLAAAIARLIDDPRLARAFADHGRATFNERFTLDAAVRRTLDLYASVVAGEGGGGSAPPPV